MTTTTTTPAITTTPDSAAQLQQELGRLRRQRNLFVLALGAVLMLGAAALVRWAPGWADPLQVALGTGGLYAPAAVMLLRRR
ncbi:hypothetical protein SLAV_39350 [Streptomyces lavendulae subsp. lavendulae]|uniref:Uncharacterized protein n=1 Tax=Streptomyces lavendulae subsp. lavendulae TaxID=58340 RepID=A0A2K8PUX0_STRLA|nr:hypothetical protein [Streptomyces lavendulae]ATZ21938.1 hypothetical protein SLAV_00040 [Streptomyces lavendulae subsp. lavendulae]ATZ29633.1 hypothetical protein SLAV_39350 [Streptomyces lavendulae subsp. lavendulae]